MNLQKELLCNNNNNTRLTAYFQDNLGQPASKKYTLKPFLDFNEAREDGVAPWQ